MVEREIRTEEGNKIKRGKTAGLDRITVDIVNCGGVSVVQWLLRILNGSLKLVAVQEDWEKI